MASGQPSRDIEKQLKILKDNLKYAVDRPQWRREIEQFKSNTRSFADVHAEMQVTSTKDVIFIVRGPSFNVGLACNLLLRRLSQNFEGTSLPAGVTPLTMENLKLHNQKDVTKRQFACEPCLHVWWRHSFQYKPVSTCKRCKKRYNAIPSNLEYGWGTYRCAQCGKIFYGRAQRGTPAPCFRCSHETYPENIGPKPQEADGRRGRHACAACDNGRIRPCPNYRPVLVASTLHVSTGSTASTFLTQNTDVW